jgi:ubiquitin-protein ligase
MVSPQTRLRRLQAEYENMQRLASDSDLISFTTKGRPPDRYVVTYRCKGLVKNGSRIQMSEHHQIEIILHQQYPDTAPQLRQLTPIFHPNFRGGGICINSGYWTARESLVDLVLRLGNMIVYRNYDPRSPMDADAAQWAQQKGL